MAGPPVPGGRHPDHGRGDPGRDRRRAARRTCGGWRPRCSARARPRSSASPATGSPSADEARGLALAAEITPEVTYLGAHVVPPEFAADPAGYVDLVLRPDADGLRAARPLDRRVLRATARSAPTRPPRCSRPARPRAWAPAMHANQLGPGPGVQVAAQAGAASADHCTYLTDADVDALAVSTPVVATLLPGAEFGTRQPYPDARRLLDAGVTVALATDCNPGSSFTSSMPFCIALAVREMRMTTEEAVWAATAGGARALRRDDVGHLGVGARADLILLDAPSHAYLAYRPGVPLIAAVWQAGRLAAGTASGLPGRLGLAGDAGTTGRGLAASMRGVRPPLRRPGPRPARPARTRRTGGSRRRGRAASPSPPRTGSGGGPSRCAARCRCRWPGARSSRSCPGRTASISRLTMAPASASSATNCSTASSMTATGWLKSSVSAAVARIVVRVAQVGVDVGARALRLAGQQRPGVGQHDGVVVDVDDPAVRRDPLRDLMGVVGGRDPGADVEELPDAPSAARNRTARARKARLARTENDQVRVGRQGPLAEFPVRGEVVLAAQPVVVDAGDMRDAGVKVVMRLLSDGQSLAGR